MQSGKQPTPEKSQLLVLWSKLFLTQESQPENKAFYSVFKFLKWYNCILNHNTPQEASRGLVEGLLSKKTRARHIYA